MDVDLSNHSPNDIEEEEEQQCIDLLQKICSNCDVVKRNIKILLDKVESGKLKFENGHKFVGLKNHLVLSYVINLMHLMHEKVSGESIENSNDRWRMIEIKTVLQKMRPIEKKLKYEIEKKLNLAFSGDLVKDDPLSFKPDPNNLMSQANDEDNSGGSDDNNDDDDDKNKLYRPPKLVPKFYDGDEPAKQKKEKLLEKARKKAMKSSIISELRKEFTDQPEEIFIGSGLNSINRKQKDKERTEYEENYFTRIQLTKKDKMEMKRMQTASSGMMGFGRFSDVAVLAGQEDDVLDRKTKKRKSRSNGKGSKKGKKIKYH